MFFIGQNIFPKQNLRNVCLWQACLMRFSKEGSEEALSLLPKQRRPTTWRITEFNKYLGSPPFISHKRARPFGRETTQPQVLGTCEKSIVIHYLATWDDPRP